MPNIPNTPESLIARSDSKNPATTCRGLTASGRPCRRSLASSPNASPGQARGVLAVLTEDNVGGGRAAAFFCWQHKDQANRLASKDNNDTEVVPLKERTSIDTIVDRLGLVDLDDDVTPTKPKHKRKRGGGQQPSRRDTLPERWHDVPGPLLSVPENMLPSHSKPYKPSKPKPKPQSNVVPSIFCCLRPADDEDSLPPRRHLQHAHHTQQPSNMGQVSARPQPQTPPRNRPESSTNPPLTPRKPTPQQSPRPSPAPAISPSSQTSILLSLIPQHLSPHTTSLLLTELAKPISPADEAGYIYMFWLTPTSNSTPSPEITSTLLTPPTDSTRSRRASDLLRSNSTRSNNGFSTILLKIGRAANVHRRLTQWTKQCSHNLTLIRYYPYQPTSSTSPAAGSRSPSPSPTPPRDRPQLLSPQPSSSDDAAGGPRKVPHVHRVERLIHLELGEKRVRDASKCDECGKAHREWFEVQASTAGLREVDGCIRRWVGWAERLGGNANTSQKPSRPRSSDGYF